MSLDRLQPHYGFTRLPFTRRIAPGQLYPAAGHQEAASRIGFLIESQAIGVITGEVGVGRPSPPGRPPPRSMAPATR